MSALEDCCCCCSVRRGSVFVGFLSLAMGVGVAWACVLLLRAEELRVVLQTAYNTYRSLEDPHAHVGVVGDAHNASRGSSSFLLELKDPELMYVEWAILALLVLMIVAAAADAFLVIGAIRETPWMLLPFMVVQWITILLTIALFGVVLWLEVLRMPRFWWAVMLVVGVVLLLVLSFVLVLSLYSSIRTRTTRTTRKRRRGRGRGRGRGRRHPDDDDDDDEANFMVHRHIWLSQKA